MVSPRLLLLAALFGVAASSTPSSTYEHESMDNLVADSIDNCIGTQESSLTCLRERMADYLGAPRSGGDHALLTRVVQIIKSHDLKVELPEALASATLVFKPGRGLDFGIEFPEENQITPRAGRDMMKQKMLFPLMMLVKLKLKALTPILLAVVGLKAMKALVLSKIAVILVVGFLIVQLCQKLGMAKMSMTPASSMVPMDTTPPPSIYGPPTSQSSYEPSSWEPMQPGPYARVYDTAQQMAYSAYTTQPAAKHKI